MCSNTEQNEFINMNNTNIKLIGIPGGGKTRTIIEKVLNMIETHIISKSNEFIILTFSKKSREDFLTKGQIKNCKIFKNDNTRTIHSLSKLCMHNIFRKNPKNVNTLVSGFFHLLSTEENINFDSVNCLKKCKYIFIDEAQDISEVQYETILKIGEICKAYTIMIGDPDQNIYQFQNGSDKYLMEHPGNTINLTKNYRSSKNIVNFINEFRPWKNVNIPMVAMREYCGDKPTVYCNSLSKLKEYILNEIKDTNIPFEDIAIIGPVKKGNFDNCGNHKNFGLQIVYDLLLSNNYKCKPHYNFCDEDTSSRRQDNFEKGHINLLTIHGAKGLEFKKVIIINFHLATMGRIPSLENYNRFKYLWYVGLSRPIDELSIYVESNKSCWSELKNVDTTFYNLIGKPLKYSDKIGENSKPLIYSVTKMIKDELFTENIQYKLERMLDCHIVEEKLFDINHSIIYEHDIFAKMYGIFIEDIFRYYYLLNFLEKNENSKQLIGEDNDIGEYISDSEHSVDFKNFINSFILRNNSHLFIPKIYDNIFKNLVNKFGKLTLTILNINKNILNDSEIEFYEYLINNYSMKIDNNQEINNINANVSIFDEEYVIKNCKNLFNKKNINESLFNLSLYFYQIEYECGHILNKDYTQHIESLEPYITKIIELTCNDFKITNFQGVVSHPHLPITGIYDAINETSIIDFKFSKSFNFNYVFQLLNYYNNSYPKWDVKKSVEIWNLYSGIKYTIKINKNFTNIMFNNFLCDTFNIKMKDQVFIYDLETTGLYTDSCDIIERHFVNLYYNDTVSTGLIKPKTYLSNEITELTGIKNSDFDYSDKNYCNLRKNIDYLFKNCNMPIFIAHNGDNFDHKILVKNNIINQYKCHLLDSREMINVLYNPSTFKKKLSMTYEMICGESKETIHRAKADTDMIIEIFNKLLITNDIVLSFIKK